MLIRLLLFSSLFLNLCDSSAWGQSRAAGRSFSKSASTRSAKNAPPSVIFHEVKKGETLWGIAQEYGKSVGEILDANHMSNDQVRAGMKLKIPSHQEEETLSEAPPKSPSRVADSNRYYIVVPKDTFYGIAQENGVTPLELQRANPNAIPTKLQIGQMLILPSKQTSKVAEKTAVAEKSVSSKTTTKMLQHTVGDRETFYSIAKIYGVSTEAMVKANPQVKPERLRKGLVVNVPKEVKETAVAETPLEVETPKPSRAPTPKFVGRPGSKVLHVVKKGETLAIIAKQYGVSTDEIKVFNRLTSRDELQEGDQLSIPPTKAK